MDEAAFRARAPEFRGATPARVTSAISQATARTDASLFGAQTEDAIFFLAAHILVSSPTGTEARLKGEAFDSVYLAERKRIEAEKGPMLGLVIGLGCEPW